MLFFSCNCSKACVFIKYTDSIEAKHAHRHKVLQEYGDDVVKEMRALSAQNRRRSASVGSLERMHDDKYIVDGLGLNYRNIGEQTSHFVDRCHY